MTSRIWEPLAELELNLYEPSDSRIYCLCSRAIIRSRIKYHNLEDFREKSRNNDILKEALLEASIQDFHLEFDSNAKQESEAASCYCSASHYSTDDYESVTHVAADHQSSFPQQSSLQNSDSGADLSEYFVEKLCTENSDFSCKYSKPKIETAWEKYWSANGENIIWKSWIEKYGAYINPNYLEQNLLGENAEKQSSEDFIEEPKCKNTPIVNSQTFVKQDDELCAVEGVDSEQEINFERIPDLKISSYPSFSSLLEGKNEAKSTSYLEDSDSEDKILKSNSFGSYSSYEKVKWVNNFSEKLKSVENERVKSRCSNTNLSVKSIANTTVTTDSMTNVTKITLSSLDLSCDNESVKSSSLFSTSSEESSRLPSHSSSSSSSSSSSKELCTEADLWWKQVWKEHYEDQYEISYQNFLVNYNTLDDGKENFSVSNTKKNSVVTIQAVLNSEKINFLDHIPVELGEEISEPEKSLSNSKMEESHSLQHETVQNLVPKSDNLKRQLEGFDSSSDLVDEMKTKSRKKVSSRKSQAEQNSEKKEHSGKADKIKQALNLMGFSFNDEFNKIHSGSVTYRKKNIRIESRHLKLHDLKPKMHVFFDDEGKSFEAKEAEISDILLSEEDTKSTKEKSFNESENLHLMEPESLGYEAHSSSVEDCENANLSKKQKKKRKKLKKYNIPQEILENKRLIKYWFRRYELFSKFDDGIKLDLESWFSVTPEKLAKHHAERCRCDVIIDAFCGAGGNSIQFAFTCERVIAIDIDPLKIEMAKHNAKIYGVDDRIEFLVGDFLSLASKLHADVVFLSPPWGGPGYMNQEMYKLENILPPLGGTGLFHLASTVAEHIAFFLPKNVDSHNLALLCGPGGEVEIEQNIIDRRVKAVTAYFGGLIMDPEDPLMENT